MKHIITILALVSGLIGCANTQNLEMNKWSAETRAKAESGEIKWSTYYIQLFDRLEKADLGQAKGPAMYVTSGLITAAQQYEAGQISKEQFEGVQRSAKAHEENMAAAAQAAKSEALSNGFHGMANASKQTSEYFQNQQRSSRTMQPSQTTCRRLGAYTTCN